MRINYAVILASVTGIIGQYYDQGFADSCGCLQTRTCPATSPCMERQKVRKVRRARSSRRTSCSSCNGPAPCGSCQQQVAPVEKRYEAVPVFQGPPQEYRVVSSRQIQGNYGYAAPSQYGQPSPNQYAYAQAPVSQYNFPQQQYQVSNLAGQYTQAPCATCGPSIQTQRVNVPLKPTWSQRRQMKKAVKTTASRQPCSGPSCTGCATCAGGSQPVLYSNSQPLPSYQIVQPPTVYQAMPPTGYQTMSSTAYQAAPITTYQALPPTVAQVDALPAQLLSEQPVVSESAPANATDAAITNAVNTTLDKAAAVIA